MKTIRKRATLSVTLVSLLLSGAIGAVTMPTGASAAPVVSAGFDPAATLTGGVRYRNLNNQGNVSQNVRIGVPPIDGVADDISGSRTWVASQCFRIRYDGTALRTDFATAATPCVFTSAGDLVSRTMSLGTPLNYIEINVTKNTNTTSVGLNGVSLTADSSTDSLGNFVVSAAPNAVRWNVRGVSLEDGFTLTGRVDISGINGGGDSNFIEILVGSVVAADTEGPVTSGVVVTPVPVLLNGDATVTAMVDDSTTGNNNIKSATYSLNGTPSAPMAAQDGAFDDEITEEVTATFTAAQIGLNTVCVAGTDALDNEGDETCQTFIVTYDFTGFFKPIDMGIVNLAKAGQAIPVKWRLTDANGVPIDDPDSFVNLYSYPINCNDLSGNPSDSIEEYAAGSSGLQYGGDGYWQFVWKTPKSYAGTCRSIYVEFNSGVTSDVVKFSFR